MVFTSLGLIQCPQIYLNMKRKLLIVAAGCALAWQYLSQTAEEVNDMATDINSFRDLAVKYGDRYQIHPALILAHMKVESNFKADAKSPINSNGTRDYGLMQINDINLEPYGLTVITVMDPERNIEAACKIMVANRNYLVSKKGRADLNDMISAYNQGVGRTVRNGILNALYVGKVLTWYNVYKTKGVA